MNKINTIRPFFIGIMILHFFISIHVSAQKSKVSCVGNSITYDYVLSDPINQSYPGQMQVLLGTSEWDVENFGSAGRTLMKSGGYSYWDDQRYNDALTSSPDFVIIELGTNDSKRWLWNSHGSEFKNDYKEMIKSFQNLSSEPEMWIGLLIPGEKPDWDIFDSYIKNKVNPKIKEVALEMGIGLIDLYTELNSNKTEWYQSDSVHPSVAGSGVIAKKVKEMLLTQKPEILYVDGKVSTNEGVEYQWYIDGVPVASENQGQQKEMTVTKSGTYKVSVKLSAYNDTRIVSKEMNISVTSSSVFFNESDEINIYPNPSNGFIYVPSNNPEPDTNYIIEDMTGKTVLFGQLIDTMGEINISSLSSGIYLFHIKNKCFKIIK
jgi:acyl-CoA thioesterase I